MLNVEGVSVRLVVDAVDEPSARAQAQSDKPFFKIKSVEQEDE